MMKAHYLSSLSTSEMTYGDVPKPKAKGNRVLVKTHAISINPHDWKMTGALAKFYKRLPLLPKMGIGHDISGVVVEVGSKVKNIKVGDEVYSMRAMPGVYAEYAWVPEKELALKPKNATHEEAAALSMAGLTAMKAFALASLKKDDKILIIGGSGGVGHLAVQIAKIKGAHVTAVCSTRNLEFVKSLGADELIDYTQENFLECGKKFNVVLITVNSGPSHLLAPILAKGAVVVSNDGAVTPKQIGQSAYRRRRDKDAVRYILFLNTPHSRRLKQMSDWFDEGLLKVNIDKSFTLDALDAAFEYGRLGKTQGKVTLRVAQ